MLTARGDPAWAKFEGDLRVLVAEKSTVLLHWMEEGRIARLDPVHLIFSIWALTQHYADFSHQIETLNGGKPLSNWAP